MLNRAVRRLANARSREPSPACRRSPSGRLSAGAARARSRTNDELLLGEREKVGSAVFENGRLTERVEALVAELEVANARITGAEARAEEAARAAARGAFEPRKVSDEATRFAKTPPPASPELRIELASSGPGVGKSADAATARERAARCRDPRREQAGQRRG